MTTFVPLSVQLPDLRYESIAVQYLCYWWLYYALSFIGCTTGSLTLTLTLEGAVVGGQLDHNLWKKKQKEQNKEA